MSDLAGRLREVLDDSVCECVRHGTGRMIDPDLLTQAIAVVESAEELVAYIPGECPALEAALAGDAPEARGGS